MFTNRNEITKDQFEDIKKSEKYEIYSQASIAKFIEDTTNSIEKAESGDLKEGEQEKLDIAKAQVLTLSPIVVLENIGGGVSNEIQKSVFYIREKIAEQVKE
jgi:ABC-type branched-subunit amino acid transport system ATPase component